LRIHFLLPLAINENFNHNANGCSTDLAAVRVMLQVRASRIMLIGVSVARLALENPAPFRTSVIRFSPACARRRQSSLLCPWCRHTHKPLTNISYYGQHSTSANT